jgi:uncharacterized transporter YbjL
MGLTLSRIRHAGADIVPSKYTILHQGDLVHAVGTRENLDRGTAYFGAVSDVLIEAPGGAVELRRVVVSNKDVVGRTLEELNFASKFNAQITRLRRADFEITPQEDMRFELGDRLLVVAPREKLAAAAEFFGDSAREAATLDFAALTFGISLGVLVGMIPIPIPGLGAVSLGIAGGPLVVALLLGHIGRTGRFVWIIPFEGERNPAPYRAAVLPRWRGRARGGGNCSARSRVRVSSYSFSARRARLPRFRRSLCCCASGRARASLSVLARRAGCTRNPHRSPAPEN